MRTYSGREVISSLGRVGFAVVSQRGSHVKLRHEDGRTVIVPDHREIARETMRSILRQAKVSTEEFESLAFPCDPHQPLSDSSRVRIAHRLLHNPARRSALAPVLAS